MFGKRVFFFLLLVTVVGLAGCGRERTDQSGTPSPTVPLIKQTTNIVTGTIVVPAGGSRDLTFYVDGLEQLNIRLVGWFHASGGSGNDIEVFVANDADYQTWNQGRRVTPLYNSGRTTLGDLNVKVPSASGRYHLVFNNIFSSSLKSVQAQIDMEYSTPVSPTPTE